MRDFRRFITPCHRIILSTLLPKNFKIVQQTSFYQMLSKEEQLQIVEHSTKGKTLFNGCTVRLDSLKNGTAILSKVGFFDFMTTNLIIKPNNSAKRSAVANMYSALFSDQVKQIMRLEHHVKAAVIAQPRKTFDDVIAIRELANIITVSVLIKDCTGRALLVHRCNKVAVSSGSFATSCAGSLDERDLATNNPFLSCAQRELKEELNLECRLHLDHMVISKQKLQPAALFSGKIESRFEDVYQQMISAPDYKEENCELFAVPPESLNGVVKKYQFTDVAAFQIAMFTPNWFSIAPHNIENYKLQ